MKKTKLSKLAFVIGFLGLAGQSSVASESAKVDALFSAYNDTTPGCSVAVDRDNKLIHVAGYGMADLEQGVPNRSETAFYAASVSKQFVAMSALLLQEQGKIDLDQPVREYLPALPEYAERVTTRNLLHHTGGVRDYFTLFALGNRLEGLVITEQKIMDILALQEGLSYEPGEKYAYSNSAYFLISQIVLATDGRNLNDFAQEHLFGPLGMTSSRFQHNHRYLVPQKAHGYEATGDHGYLQADSLLDVVGSGGMYTTVLDLTKWARNFRDNQLAGGAAVIDEMQKVGILNSGQETDYGLGIRVSNYRGLEWRSHGGSLRGYRTYLSMFPEQKFSIALLCNDRSAVPADMAARISEIYLGDKFTEEAPVENKVTSSHDLPAHDYAGGGVDEFAGRYYSREVDGTQVLGIDKHGLVLVDRSESEPLMRHSEDTFGPPERRFELVFRRDELGAVSGFEYNGSRAAGIIFERIEE